MTNDFISAATIVMALATAPVASAGETVETNPIQNIRQEQVFTRGTREGKDFEDYEESFFREDEPTGDIKSECDQGNMIFDRFFE